MVLFLFFMQQVAEHSIIALMVYGFKGVWKALKIGKTFLLVLLKQANIVTKQDQEKKDIEDIGRKCSSGSCYMQWPTCSLWMEVSTVQEGGRNSQRDWGSLPMSSSMFLYKASSTAHSIDIWIDPQRLCM